MHAECVKEVPTGFVVASVVNVLPFVEVMEVASIDLQELEEAAIGVIPKDPVIEVLKHVRMSLGLRA
ncbi:MAG: hypothetical protein SFV81_21285 [Pirellulaceae bacterium]|nr:hypothetical protein [Pirellulaceae bacterium]